VRTSFQTDQYRCSHASDERAFRHFPEQSNQRANLLKGVPGRRHPSIDGYFGDVQA